MTEYEYNAMRKRHCESVVQRHFHLHLPVEELLFDDIETGADSYAVLFRSGRHLYALFVDEQQRQTLSDVKSMMRSMGIKPLKVLPPHADPEYFAREAEHEFSTAYPAIKMIDPETIRFYQGYVTYAPGLVRIGEINGSIKRYVSIVPHWQTAFEYRFKRIQVS